MAYKEVEILTLDKILEAEKQVELYGISTYTKKGTAKIMKAIVKTVK